MVNIAILCGRLGKDPETRYTSAGQAVCNFSLATDETYKDRNGDKQQKTEWHNIVMWGKLAEIAQEYLKKGALVHLVGKLQTRKWEDKRDGSTKYTTEVVVNNMKMLGGTNGGGQGGNKSAGNKTANKTATKTAGKGSTTKSGYKKPEPEGPEISDEDIPF